METAITEQPCQVMFSKQNDDSCKLKAKYPAVVGEHLKPKLR